MTKQLVIGLGEVGSAIQKILECDGYDFGIQGIPTASYDVLHICFPYNEHTFEDDVHAYSQSFLKEDADLIIVHSTVPLGTCDSNGWIHSPVRGVHPHLERGIRTFQKFFGGSRAHEAADLFRKVGIRTLVGPDARETEAMKLWDTTIYGWNILIEKAIRAYCNKNNLDFGTVYTLANQSYNEGYEKLGMPQYSKYVLKDFPGPIGGHCVKENWELLGDPISEISKDLHKRFLDS